MSWVIQGTPCLEKGVNESTTISMWNSEGYEKLPSTVL